MYTVSCHQQYQSENVCMHFAVYRLKNGLKFDADDSLRHYKKGNARVRLKIRLRYSSFDARPTMTTYEKFGFLDLFYDHRFSQRILHLYLDDDVPNNSEFPLSQTSDFHTLITPRWLTISMSFFHILKI